MRRTSPWMLCAALLATSAWAHTDPAPALHTRTRVESVLTLAPHGQALAQWRWAQGFTWRNGGEEAADAPTGWQAHLGLEVQADTQGLARGGQTWATHQQRPPALALDQAHVQWHGDTGGGTWRVRLGRQVLDWATTDTVSPLDAMQTRDWSDLSRVRKRPLPALSVRWSGPAGDSGAPPSVEWALASGGQALLPQGVWADALPAGVTLAPTSPTGSRMGLRLTTPWGEGDVSAVLYRGPSLSPAARLQPQATGQLTLQPVHDTVHLLGLGWTHPVAEGSLFRAEWARQRQSSGDDFDTLVASVDHEFSGLLQPRDTLYLLVQGQWEHVRRRGEASPPGWWDFRRVLVHHTLVRAQYKPAQSPWQWSLEATLHPSTRQHYLRLLAQRTLDRHWHLDLGLVSVGGQSGSFWGSHRAARQLFASWVWTP